MKNDKQVPFKLTPQRMAILKYLDGNKEHPSAEDIFKGVSKKFPTMSFATVYNTLEVLKKRGQIAELNFDPFKKRFDPNPEPHHHIICLGCQKILDVNKKFAIDPPQMEGGKFEIIGSHIEFYGFCSKCKDKT